jgi:thiol-disulfide isomerase/thioredoxin
MNSRRKAIGTLLAAPCALLSWPGATTARAAAAPAVGSKLPLVDLPLIDGGTFRASQAERQVVVVYWWASWCPFCAEMTPSVERLWRDHRNDGLSVIGISIDKGIEAAREHRLKRGYTFPSAMYARGVESALPKPKAVPALWVRDRDGRVVMAEIGQLFPEDVAQISRFL